MKAVLLSTFMFIPRGETEVLKIYFYLSELTGVWNVDNNHVFVDQQTYRRWRDAMNDPAKQKRFFDQLTKISANVIG